MTSVEADTNGSKACPQCCSIIAENAVKCPQCRSDLSEKSVWVRASSILRDTAPWLSLPTALVAFVAALFNPIAGTLLGAVQRDGAVVSASLLGTDVISVGSDDTLAQERTDRITQTERIIRGVLVNNGFSVGAIASDFSCTLVQGGERYRYALNFYDPIRQVKIFPDIDARSSMSFVGRLDSSLPARADTQFSSCELAYSDKYGDIKLHSFSFSSEIEERFFSLVSMSIGDELEALRNLYCADMTRKLRVGDTNIECIDGNYAYALEYTHNWVRAAGLSIASSDAFNQLAVSERRLKPGLILVCNGDESDEGRGECTRDVSRAKEFFERFGIEAEVIQCGRSDIELQDCIRP